jgi:hypothetical protein
MAANILQLMGLIWSRNKVGAVSTAQAPSPVIPANRCCAVFLVEEHRHASAG